MCKRAGGAAALRGLLTRANTKEAFQRRIAGLDAKQIIGERAELDRESAFVTTFHTLRRRLADRAPHAQKGDAAILVPLVEIEGDP